MDIYFLFDDGLRRYIFRGETKMGCWYSCSSSICSMISQVHGWTYNMFFEYVCTVIFSEMKRRWNVDIVAVIRRSPTFMNGHLLFCFRSAKLYFPRCNEECLHFCKGCSCVECCLPRSPRFMNRKTMNRVQRS